MGIEQDYLAAIETGERRLRALSDEEATTPPAPGKWCPKEVLGHLIDSAANNHQRFVRMQTTGPLIGEGYDQNDWVRRQGCAGRPWTELVSLWSHYNRHLAFVVGRIPEEDLKRARPENNLRQIAWKNPAPNQPATLEYVIRDYIGHMNHHLDQILQRDRTRR